jgi:hypothetical protein
VRPSTTVPADIRHSVPVVPDAAGATGAYFAYGPDRVLLGEFREALKAIPNMETEGAR